MSTSESLSKSTGGPNFDSQNNPPTSTDPEDLYQIALLIDQLKHDDVQIRVNASRNLPLIGKVAF
jgi:hypothetical protein